MNKEEVSPQWEIDFLKCVTWRDYKQYCDKYASNPNNPFLSQAFERYDDLYFKAFKAGGWNMDYLSRFPQGKHYYEAANMKFRKEEAARNRREQIENIGAAICGILLIGSFLVLWLGTDLTFVETLLVEVTLVPLYYTIIKLTSKD